MALHTSLILDLRSAVRSELQIGVPARRCVAALQTLKGAQNVRSLRLKLEVSLKDMLQSGTIGGQHDFVRLDNRS